MINSPNRLKKTNVVQGAAAFAKGIGILQLIADSDNRPTISQLVKESGLPRPTLYRLLKALAAEGLVDARKDKTYAVGTRLIQLAGRALQQNDLVRIAEPELERLCETTQETVHLAIRSGNELVYAMKRDSPKAVRIVCSLGEKVSLHASAIGKCILAHLPAEEQAEVIGELDMHRFTKFTKTDKIQLTNDLSEYRAQGFATSHQETHLEIECYGSVIYDHEGSPVAGVGVSVPLYRLNPRKELYVKPLIACCQRISRCLGGEI